MDNTVPTDESNTPISNYKGHLSLMPLGSETVPVHTTQFAYNKDWATMSKLTSHCIVYERLTRTRLLSWLTAGWWCLMESQYSTVLVQSSNKPVYLQLKALTTKPSSEGASRDSHCNG